MTEDEAKTKWCPFARVRELGSQAVVNRPFGTDGTIVTDEACCIGTACMAWRVSTDGIERKRTDYGRMPDEDDGPQWRQVKAPRGKEDEGLFWERIVSKGSGYCGLAGAP